MQDTLLVELLTEELPAKPLRLLALAFGQGIYNGLKDLSYLAGDSGFEIYATPRRLAVVMQCVLATQPERAVERKGPALASALTAEGRPTPALAGFAKSCGVPVEKLERQSDGKAEYFIFRSRKAGAALDARLADIVKEAIKKLPITKIMRWGDGEEQFVRPAHGLVMLHGEHVIEGKVLGLSSGKSTLGHRFMSSGSLSIEHAAKYEQTLAVEGRVIANFDRRLAEIRDALERAAKGARVLGEDALLNEVTGLVEYPAVYAGAFDPAFLRVPQECLILSMQQHQKYFPLTDSNGRLLPKFLLVSNLATDDPHHIIHGNERVLRARLSDAQFFFEHDKKTKLEARVAKLADVVYQNKLGSQLERVQRIQKLAGTIARKLSVDAAAAERAALLCKADLLTDMVGEFPELQGVMGMYYAHHDGEAQSVADAIEGHYRPRFANDALPVTSVAASVALADKLDTLVGMFGVGLVPSGDKDPFALRRHALGVLRILAEKALPLDLAELLQFASGGFAKDLLSDKVAADLLGFMSERLRSYLRDNGYSADETEAVVSQNPTRIDLVPPRLKAVQAFKRLPEAQALASANKRIQNILRKASLPDVALQPNLLREPAERALFSALGEASSSVGAELARARYTEALTQLASLRSAVDRFFDEVMVMSEDARLRDNRLALLSELARLMNQVADISKLVA